MDNQFNNSNATLVAAYQSGNREVLPELVRRWHKVFCNRAYYLVKDADVAKDIAQDSWAVIIEKLFTLKDPRTFPNWALRIVYGKSIDWLRKQNRKRENQEKYRLEQVDEGIETEHQQLKNKLKKAIKGLPKEQQEVLHLFYTQDYKLREIAELLNVSIGTAKSRLFHARERLKQLLKNRNYEN